MAIIGKGGPTLDRMICIAGPTASGKTELAVALVRALDHEAVESLTQYLPGKEHS